jgi:hypothetical protein
VLQLLAYTTITVVSLVLGFVEHRGLLVVTAIFGTCAIATTVLLLRSKSRTGEAD